MSPADRVSIVCFDLGGVLVRICRSWEEACQAAGLEVRGESASDDAERRRLELLELYSTGQISGRAWGERLSDALDGAYSPAELSRIHDAVTLREYAGVLTVIEEIHAAGVATACLSNTTHAHWVRLMHLDGERPLLGDPEYPAVRRLGQHYASHLFGLVKPHEAIYRAFERATGYGGESILFFDDLPENVASAKAIGWRAERIDPHAETAPQLRGHLARLL